MSDLHCRRPLSAFTTLFSINQSRWLRCVPHFQLTWDWKCRARLSGAIWPGPTDAAITAQAAGGGARLIRSAPLSPGGRGAGGEGESGTQRQILFDSEPPPLPNPLPPGERGKSRPHGFAKGLFDRQANILFSIKNLVQERVKREAQETRWRAICSQHTTNQNDSVVIAQSTWQRDEQLATVSLHRHTNQQAAAARFARHD